MSFKFKRLLASVALGVAAMSAHAVTPATPLTPGTWGFAGLNDEFFSFLIPSAGTYTFTVTAGSTGLLHDLTLSDGSFTQVADFLNVNSPFANGSVSVAGPGTYYLYVDVLNGNTQYFGGFGVTSAVPEPETYALMLAGLGALGFMARRRKLK